MPSSHFNPTKKANASLCSAASIHCQSGADLAADAHIATIGAALFAAFAAAATAFVAAVTAAVWCCCCLVLLLVLLLLLLLRVGMHPPAYRGLGHFGEQEGLQKGSGRPFRLFKYMGGGGGRGCLLSKTCIYFFVG